LLLSDGGRGRSGGGVEHTHTFLLKKGLHRCPPIVAKLCNPRKFFFSAPVSMCRPPVLAYRPTRRITAAIQIKSDTVSPGRGGVMRKRRQRFEAEVAEIQ